MSIELNQIKPEEIGSRHICTRCEGTFTTKGSLTRHLTANTCTEPKIKKSDLVKTIKDMMEEVVKKSETMMEEVVKKSETTILAKIDDRLTRMSEGHGAVINNSHNDNRNLNILCLGNNDNLLDMLATSEGLPLALTYMKGCALARLAGDCRILERVYKLDTAQAAIMYVGKSKTKFVYYDQRQRRTIESNISVMAKKMSDILQRSYLKGMECFRTDILGDQRDDVPKNVDLYGGNMPELESYDIQIWNAHIHELADEKYQKKVLKSLKIPIEPNRE
jgi:hypothetical protein